MGKRFTVKGRIWIEGTNGAFLGYGRIKLLEKIRETGSISEAARATNMSYKHAWDLLESMNRQARRKLTITSTGGKGGGGTKLTKYGEEVIEKFWKMWEEFEQFLNEKTLEW